ncbi:MAG: DUF4197 domain-containing protein [Pseudomonadota bacterium]
MNEQLFNRRFLLAAGASVPLLSLSACASMGGGFSLVEAIRRLLTLSSQRAFAALLQPGGFYDHSLARIALPAQFAGGGSLISQVLGSAPVRERLARSLNSVAERGAERAAPIITDAITSISIADAVSIVRGVSGPAAATALLEQQLGGGLVSAMFPAVGDALRLTQNDIVGQALRVVSGYDIAGLARDVTDGANSGIWRAISAEESAIRANPQATNDPLLIAVFGLGGAGR